MLQKVHPKVCNHGEGAFSVITNLRMELFEALVSTVSRLPHHLIDKYETSARDQQQQPAELTLLEYRYLERDREMRRLLFFSL